MFVKNIGAALAVSAYPRNSTGLKQVAQEVHEAAPRTMRHIPAFYIEPSAYVTCSACGMVSEWPACSYKDD
jgi:hypothetical protein